MSDDRNKDPRRDDEPLEFVNREDGDDVDMDEQDDFESLPDLGDGLHDDEDADLEEFEAADVPEDDDGEPTPEPALAAMAGTTGAAAQAEPPGDDGGDVPPSTARPRGNGGGRKGPPVIMLAALGLIVIVALFMFWPRGGGIDGEGDGQSSVLTLPDSSDTAPPAVPAPRSSDVDLDRELDDVVPEEADGAAGAAARVDLKREAESRRDGSRELAEPDPATPAEEAPARNTEPATTPTSTSTSPSPGAASVSGPSREGAWAIQIGSFGDAANAERLASQLRAKDYRVVVQDLNGSHKVWVGFFVTQAAARAYAATRTADLGAKPYITHR